MKWGKWAKRRRRVEGGIDFVGKTCKKPVVAVNKAAAEEQNPFQFQSSNPMPFAQSHPIESGN
jgi:hypothetical protein